jgi:hypothetical protein
LIGNSGYSKPALSLSALNLIEKQRPGLDGILGRLLFYYVPRFLWKPEIATLSGLSNKHKVKKKFFMRVHCHSVIFLFEREN